MAVVCDDQAGVRVLLRVQIEGEQNRKRRLDKLNASKEQIK